MKDPIDGRALDARLPPYVKDLLAAERDAPPPPHVVEERVRARVAATVVAAGAVGLAGSAGAATAAGATAKAAGAGAIGSALGVKASLIAVAIAAGATATGGYVMHARRAQAPAHTTSRHEPASRAAVATVASPAPPSAAQPQRVPIAVEPPPVVAAIPVPAAAEPNPRRRAAKRAMDDVTPSASPAPSGLTAENVPIAAALAALARGTPADAIAALERHARAFPGGQLEEEREALWIQALIAAGDIDQARSRAAGFRRRFPGSIQEAAVAAALAKIP